MGTGLNTAIRLHYVKIVLALGVCIAGLIYVVLIPILGSAVTGEWTDGDRQLLVRPVDAQTKVAALMTGLPQASSDDHVAALLARPLFEPGRRPPAPVQVEPPTQIPPRLTGIVIASGRSVAIFQQGSSPRSIALEAGGLLDGKWTVESITAGEVTIAREDTLLIVTPLVAANRDPPRSEPIRFWKVGLRRSDAVPTYLHRLK